MAKLTGKINVYYPGRDPKNPHTIDTGSSVVAGTVAKQLIDGMEVVLHQETDAGLYIVNDSRDFSEGTFIEFPIED